MAKNRNRGRTELRHVRLYHYMTNSPAWRDLGAVPRAIYCEIARRYAGPGSNNGRIPYSVREGAAELKIGTATVSRALAVLEDHGFIVPIRKGAFSVKVRRQATEWLLTEFASDVTQTGIASKDFMQWQPSSPSPYRAARRRHEGVAYPPGKLEVYLS